MKNFLLLALVAAGAWWFWRRRVRPVAAAADANPGSLQANRPVQPITRDTLRDQLIVDGVQSVPTILKGLAPSRWFNADETRQIYDENAAGGNVSANEESFEE